MKTSGALASLQKRWWVLAVLVLLLLLGVIYVLAHLSAADSEMYPTTMLCAQQAIARLC